MIQWPSRIFDNSASFWCQLNPIDCNSPSLIFEDAFANICQASEARVRPDVGKLKICPKMAFEAEKASVA